MLIYNIKFIQRLILITLPHRHTLRRSLDACIAHAHVWGAYIYGIEYLPSLAVSQSL